METLKLISTNFPKILYAAIPIVGIILAIRIMKNLVVKIVTIVVCLILIGVITVSSTTGKTDFTIHGKSGDKTVTVLNDGSKVTGVEYEGEDAGEMIGKVRDTLTEDYNEFTKPGGALEQITDSMKKGAEESGEVLDWLRDAAKGASSGEETPSGEAAN